jgi:hypothetical protein
MSAGSILDVIFLRMFLCFINWAPCYNGMSYCQVEDLGEGLQIKMVDCKYVE